MFKKSILIVYTIIIMFNFFGKADAKYDKLFFDLNIKDINGLDLNLNHFKDKTILVVNVASKCGFTKQYTALQSLYEKYRQKGLVVCGYS